MIRQRNAPSLLAISNNMFIDCINDLQIFYILAIYRRTRNRKPIPGERFKCSTCPKSFKYVRLLNFHRRHECGKEMKCENCSKTFNFFVQLCEHRKFGCNTEFECVTCMRRYTTPSSIRAHTFQTPACAIPGVRWNQINQRQSDYSDKRQQIYNFVIVKALFVATE